jgi:hypothetical protein
VVSCQLFKRKTQVTTDKQLTTDYGQLTKPGLLKT